MTTSAGHNSVEAGRLRAFVERIERLHEERQTIADDIKDVFAEAKGVGYDTKIMKKVIAIRRMDRSKRQEEEALLELYMAALGDDV